MVRPGALASAAAVRPEQGIREGAVKSARRVVAIFELLASQTRPLSLTEVADALAIPKSSAHGLLQTLVGTGFLTRVGDSGYKLSIKWLALVGAALDSAIALESGNLRQVAYPVMLDLSQRMRMTCNLAVLNGHHVVYIDKVQDRTNPIQLSTHTGASLPAHATALGKALVAHLPGAERLDWLDGFTPHPVTAKTRISRKAFETDLDECVRLGYAIDDEESHIGVMCFAAPIMDREGHPLAAISLTAFKAAAEGLGRGAVGDQVRAGARTISDALGGVAPPG